MWRPSRLKGCHGLLLLLWINRLLYDFSIKELKLFLMYTGSLISLLQEAHSLINLT